MVGMALQHKSGCANDCTAQPYGSPAIRGLLLVLLQVLATTDVCLRVISKELVPLNPTLLVSYDLPTRKVSQPPRVFYGG